VIVAASELLAGLKQRATTDGCELLEFTDANAANALQTIVQRRPAFVALERMFALTPRGAALINRIKADPTLRDTEIRVMAHNGDYMRVVPRTVPLKPAKAPALDQRGTRRAPRFKVGKNVVAVLDGKSGTIIDLSTMGAQVMTPDGLKPNQRVAMALADDTVRVDFTASVAWTAFEMTASGTPRFRAGLNFEDADRAAVEAFCARHQP
jgi:metal-sulfur cluster biosynthetic enzyme